MPRKTKEVDEVYLRLKFAIEQWWEKNGHTIDATSSRFKPKHVLGRFLYSLGGRVEHPKLGQWFAQILTRTIQATGGNKKRKRKRGGGGDGKGGDGISSSGDGKSTSSGGSIGGVGSRSNTSSAAAAAAEPAEAAAIAPEEPKGGAREARRLKRLAKQQEWAAKQAAEGGGAATEATAGAAADGDANGESETSPAKKNENRRIAAWHGRRTNKELPQSIFMKWRKLIVCSFRIVLVI